MQNPKNKTEIETFLANKPVASEIFLTEEYDTLPSTIKEYEEAKTLKWQKNSKSGWKKFVEHFTETDEAF